MSALAYWASARGKEKTRRHTFVESSRSQENFVVLQPLGHVDNLGLEFNAIALNVDVIKAEVVLPHLIRDGRYKVAV